MRCGGSGKRQMLAWLPDDKGYPGAVVCLNCSLGIQVRKGTVRKAVSQTGVEGFSGIVKTHDRPTKQREPQPDDIVCAEETCDKRIPNHAWGRIKSGWFQKKDGTAWCPDHTPDWVASWRSRKAGK